MGKCTVAVFSDIHSGHRAFKTCYEDALAHGAQSFVFLGDYVSDLGDPEKTMELVHEIRAAYPTVCLRGNRERYMLEHEQGLGSFRRGSKSGSLLFTYERLRSRDLEFFRGLEMFDTVELHGVRMELAHAAREDDRFCFEKDGPEIGRIFSGMTTDLMLTGHTHRQYVAKRAGKTIVNPGSVGVPQGGSWMAEYALLYIEAGAVTVELRQVPYDLVGTIRAQFRSGLTAYSNCWGISVLYDLIYGEERTLRLLERVEDVQDESLWHRAAEALGMESTEEAILELARGLHPEVGRYEGG